MYAGTLSSQTGVRVDLPLLVQDEAHLPHHLLPSQVPYLLGCPSIVARQVPGKRCYAVASNASRTTELHYSAGANIIMFLGGRRPEIA